LDKQESFVFAEMLKYMWLIHVEVSDNPLNIATKLTFCRTHMLDGTSKIAVQA
jgi:hypothetical protein